MAATYSPKVVVVGGGIGGCAAAIALHQAGVDVTVYERVRELKEFGAGINVSGPAISALAKLGISADAFSDPLRGDGVVVGKERLWTVDGVFISEANVSQGQHAMHRAKLHAVLVDECQRILGPERVRLGHELVSMRQTDNGVTAVFKVISDGERRNDNVETHQTHGRAYESVGELLPEIHADCIIGCDGLKSVVRQKLLGDGAPRYTGRVLYRGVAEVDAVLPADICCCGASEPRGPGVFIAYPISARLRASGRTLVNWLLYTTKPAPEEGESWANRTDFSNLLPALTQLGANTQFGGLTPLQIGEAAVAANQPIVGWALFDRDPLETWDFGLATLLGDAAHPMLPFGGQGGSQALVDAVALGEAFAQTKQDGSGVRGAIQAYSAARCEATGRLVVQNRKMGPVGGLDLAHEACMGKTLEEKEAWLGGNKDASTSVQKFCHEKLIWERANRLVT